MEQGLKEMNFFGVRDGELSRRNKAGLYRTMKSVVVSVEVYHEKDNTFDIEGVAVFISPHGYLLTMSNVIGGNSDTVVQVKTTDGVIFPCHVIDVDNSLGLAILQIGELDGNENFPYAKVYGGNLQIGEQIYPIGHPFYLENSYSIGRISHPCRKYRDLLQSFEQDPNPPRDTTCIEDPSKDVVCYVYDVNEVELDDEVSLVQVNNIHGDGLGGSMGMPMFNYNGHIIGLYAFAAHEQCFGIHAQCIRSYINENLGIRY